MTFQAAATLQPQSVENGLKNPKQNTKRNVTERL